MDKCNKRYFRNQIEVVFGGSYLPAVMYDMVAHVVEHVAYFIAEGGRIGIDHLPTTGYSISKYDFEEYGEKFVFLNCDVYPFWEVMFLDENEHPVLNLETGEIKNATLKVVPSGVGTCFRLDYNGESEYCPRSDYEKRFVILKTETK